MTDLAEQFHGTWVLKSFEAELQDSRQRLKPWGDNPNGYVVLTPDGRMIALLTAGTRRRYAGQRILVVDDDPVNRVVVVMHLEEVDLVVDTAEDGADAIAMTLKNSYTAIFMDMQMSQVNGLEATGEIRHIPGYRDVPIIAMTANVFAEDKARCLEAGMNDFLTKPFTPGQLFAILLRALSQREGYPIA